MFEKETEEYVDLSGNRNYTERAFKDGAEYGYNKANEYAKTIIQDLLDNSDEYARERAINFLRGQNVSDI